VTQSAEHSVQVRQTCDLGSVLEVCGFGTGVLHRLLPVRGPSNLVPCRGPALDRAHRAASAMVQAHTGAEWDRTGERHLYLALPALAGALGFLAVTRTGNTALLVAALSLTAFGVLGWLGPFWALPTAFLREQGAAGGIALINSMGAFGGFVGPYLVGRVKERTGEFTPGLLLLAGCLGVAAAIVIGLRVKSEK
jgi:nitrate/nitrite transporter NarK